MPRDRAEQASWNSEVWLRWLLVFGFLFLCGFDLWHHELWRDEMQPWLYARDSATIPELFRNMHYETHPRLWYLILHAVAQISRDPAAMQVTNLLVIGSAIALFVWFCPLPLRLKAPIVFGYYFVYEWGTISRNYALGVLFCFAFCALLPRRNKGYLGLATILFLASQSNHYAALLAAVLGGLLISEAWTTPEAWERIRTHQWDAALSILLVYGGVFVTFWMGIPPHDAGPRNYSLALDSWNKVSHAFAAMWSGFVPIPEPSLLRARRGDMAGQFLFGSSQVPALLGMILFAATAGFFRRSRPIFWGYLAGASLLVILAVFQVATYARHAGHFYLWFLVCIWLAHCFPDHSAPAPGRPFKLSLWQKVFLCSILAVHLFDSAFLSAADYCCDFSCAKSVARFIERSGLKELPIIAYPDSTTMPVAGYLDRLIYYADTRRWGTFLIENNQRHKSIGDSEFLQSVNDFAQQGRSDFLVLRSTPITVEQNNHTYNVRQMGNLREVAIFRPAMEGDEIYWIYRYTNPSAP